MPLKPTALFPSLCLSLSLSLSLSPFSTHLRHQILPSTSLQAHHRRRCFPLRLHATSSLYDLAIAPLTMALTIAGLSPSSSTIEHFRKHIYRPRLCLLLLILLLSPHNASQLYKSARSSSGNGTEADTDVAVIATTVHPSGLYPAAYSASTEWAVSMIDGLVVAAPVRPAASPLSLHAPPSTPPQLGGASPAPSATGLLYGSGSGKGNGKSKGNSDGKGNGDGGAGGFAVAPSQPTPASASRAQHRVASSHQESQPAPGSLFRLPRPSWGLLLDDHVLPFIFPLHALWGIRFCGMAVEDGIVRSSLIGSKSRFHAFTLPLVQLGVLALLALSLGTAPFIDSLAWWCVEKRAALGLEDARLSTRQESLLPLSLLVGLELMTVLLSLASALFKIDDPALGFLPKTVRLPSPSHSPSLIELLPLLPTFVAALAGSSSAAHRSAGSGHRRRRARRSVLASAMESGGDVPAAEPARFAEVLTTTEATATAGDDATAAGVRIETDETILPREQIYRQVGTDGLEVLRSTSVAQPIAPLRLTVAAAGSDSGSSPSFGPWSDRQDAASPSPAITGTGPGTGTAGTNATTNTSAPARRRIKAPRLRNQHAWVTSRWLSETVVSLVDKLVGSVLYAIVTLHLPTLSPTSLPPVLSLLSLRSELSSLTTLWSQARGSVECLEFVRRRWGVQLNAATDTDPYPPRLGRKTYRWTSQDEVTCCICFEATRPRLDGERKKQGEEDKGEERDKGEKARTWRFCRLDCGHEIHDECLMAWLTSQAFCPTCHEVLSFSPPELVNEAR
ncbi:hypothetical protein ACQY0O_000564 [Thecaphora frezii]